MCRIVCVWVIVCVCVGGGACACVGVHCVCVCLEACVWILDVCACVHICACTFMCTYVGACVCVCVGGGGAWGVCACLGMWNVCEWMVWIGWWMDVFLQVHLCARLLSYNWSSVHLYFSFLCVWSGVWPWPPQASQQLWSLWFWWETSGCCAQVRVHPTHSDPGPGKGNIHLPSLLLSLAFYSLSTSSFFLVPNVNLFCFIFSACFSASSSSCLSLVLQFFVGQFYFALDIGLKHLVC